MAALGCSSIGPSWCLRVLALTALHQHSAAREWRSRKCPRPGAAPQTFFGLRPVPKLTGDVLTDASAWGHLEQRCGLVQSQRLAWTAGLSGGGFTQLGDVSASLHMPGDALKREVSHADCRAVGPAHVSQNPVHVGSR
jgi:hypothetical protein